MVNALDISVEQLIDKVEEMHRDGQRFVTITAMDTGEAFVLYYHFDKDLILTNIRLSVPKEQEIPSISKVYFSALLVENELQDLFGIKFKDIVVDYGGKLILGEQSPITPQARIEIVRKKADGAAKGDENNG